MGGGTGSGVTWRITWDGKERLEGTQWMDGRISYECREAVADRGGLRNRAFQLPFFHSPNQSPILFRAPLPFHIS